MAVIRTTTSSWMTQLSSPPPGLSRLYETLNHHSILGVRYSNKQRGQFLKKGGCIKNSLFLRFQDGYANLFSNGKVQIIGVTSLSTAQQILSIITESLQIPASTPLQLGLRSVKVTDSTFTDWEGIGFTHQEMTLFADKYYKVDERGRVNVKTFTSGTHFHITTTNDTLLSAIIQHL